VADQNHDIYATHSHRELYDQLMAGKPDQVDGHAATLRRLHETLDGLSRTLSTDLQELGNAWSSSSGQEYTSRIGAITTYSSAISQNFSTLSTNLSAMASDLRTAQKQAQSPDKTDGNSNMVKDAAIGGAVFGVPGAVIGGIFGHNQDEEAKQKAQEQMARLVANLAGQYQAHNDRAPQPAPQPVNLPGGGSGGQATPHGGPGGVGARGYAGPAGGGSHTTQSGGGDLSGLTPVAPVSPLGSGSSLLGASGALLGSAVLSGAALDSLRGSAPTGGGATSTGLDRAAGGGVIGGDEGDPHRSGTGVQAAKGGRPTGGPAEDEASIRNRAGMGTGNANRAAIAGRSDAIDDEPDEHLTWLVEDEMVWGGDAPAPPAVLGVDTPAAEPEQ
jgi:uncharacterized protein YukE